MDLLGPELSKRATQIYRHTLTNVLETALNSSNAKFEVRVWIYFSRSFWLGSCTSHAFALILGDAGG